MKAKFILITLFLTIISVNQRIYSQSQLNLNGKYKNSNDCILTITKYKADDSFHFEFICSEGFCEGNESSGDAKMSSENSAEYFETEDADEKPINFDLSKNKIVFTLPEGFLAFKCEQRFDTTFIKIVPKKVVPKKKK